MIKKEENTNVNEGRNDKIRRRGRSMKMDVKVRDTSIVRSQQSVALNDILRKSQARTIAYVEYCIY